MAILSDILISNKIKIKNFGENIAGAMIGSVFLVFSMPLIGMTYVQFYVFSGVSGYELLPEFSDTLLMILGIMSIPGAIMGWISVRLAKRKILIPAESVIWIKPKHQGLLLFLSSVIRVHDKIYLKIIVN